MNFTTGPATATLSLAALLAIAPPGCMGTPAAAHYDPALTPVAGAPGVEVVEERHSDGTLKLRKTELDGKAHGTWQEWNEDGSPRYIGQWRDGLGEGVWTYFHPNGQIRYQTWVTADIWHGPTEGWHPNGAKAFSGTMVDGAKVQPFAYWDEGGAWAGPLPRPVADARARLFAGDWPDGLNQWDFTFTPDLETLFFGTGTDEGEERRIMMRSWKEGAWSAPALVPFSNATASEGTPIVSPDGAYVYFSSDRQRASEPDNTNRELYRASRASGWREVERITNTPLYGEVTLSLACDGRGMLWTDRRLDGEARMGLYEVRMRDGALDIVTPLNDLHTGDRSNENYTAITPEGEAIVFANWGIGGDTDEDLYLSRRTAAGWSAPEPLGPLTNTDAGETSPYFTLDGEQLLFISADDDGTRRWFSRPMAALGLGDLVAPALERERCTVPHG